MKGEGVEMVTRNGGRVGGVAITNHDSDEFGGAKGV